MLIFVEVLHKLMSSPYLQSTRTRPILIPFCLQVRKSDYVKISFRCGVSLQRCRLSTTSTDNKTVPAAQETTLGSQDGSLQCSLYNDKGNCIIMRGPCWRLQLWSSCLDSIQVSYRRVVKTKGSVLALESQTRTIYRNWRMHCKMPSLSIYSIMQRLTPGFRR
jgi:hypothetical protein